MALFRTIIILTLFAFGNAVPAQTQDKSTSLRKELSEEISAAKRTVGGMENSTSTEDQKALNKQIEELKGLLNQIDEAFSSLARDELSIATDFNVQVLTIFSIQLAILGIFGFAFYKGLIYKLNRNVEKMLDKHLLLLSIGFYRDLSFQFWEQYKDLKPNDGSYGRMVSLTVKITKRAYQTLEITRN